MNRYDAVLFDIGGTLLHASPDVAETFTEVAQRRGHDVALSDALPFMDRVNGHYEREYERDGDFWCSHERSRRIWLEMYTMLADFVGLHGDAKGISEEIYETYLHAHHWACYAGVSETLRALKERGVRMGVVSNWDASLEGLLDELGLLPFFDAVVASAAVGRRKPDRAIFDIALERLGVDSARTLHVGDLPEADGDGAAAAGITPLIVDRTNAHPDCKYRRIASLEEIAGFVDA